MSVLSWFVGKQFQGVPMLMSIQKSYCTIEGSTSGLWGVPGSASTSSLGMEN